MRHRHSVQPFLFGDSNRECPPKALDSLFREPAFALGDRLWPLDLIDPRFQCDPLFDASEELVSRTSRRRRGPTSVAPFALALTLAAGVLVGCGERVPAERALDSILVQMKPGEAGPALAEFHDDGPPIVPIVNVAPLESPPLLRLPVPRAKTPEECASELAEDPAVEFAEPIYIYRTSRTPDDARFKDLWGLSQIDAPAAWEKTTGDRSVVVAIVDDEAALDHPDLEPNRWADPELDQENDRSVEAAPDDASEHDFVEEASRLKARRETAGWHGSHVAGTIGAAGNNGVGVVGVSWDVSLMALRAFGPQGGRSDALVRAIDFASEHGARVINGSWGGGGESKALARSIARAGRRGVLFVAAAGNEAAGDPSYPASLRLPNLLSVGALGAAHALAPFSNLHADVAAPGVGILSTTAPGRYERHDGTSMAAAHVSGLAALLWSRHPEASLAQVRSAIVETGIDVDGTKHGSVSALRALLALADEATSPPTLVVGRKSLAVAMARDSLRVQQLVLRSDSGAPLPWRASTDARWIRLRRTVGTTPASLPITLDSQGLSPGVHRARVTLRPDSGEPTRIDVVLTVLEHGPPPLASGRGCSVRGMTVLVKAGTICRLSAPGIDPWVHTAGLQWVLPGGRHLAGDRLTARFLRRGHFALRVVSGTESDRQVDVEVV